MPGDNMDDVADESVTETRDVETGEDSTAQGNRFVVHLLKFCLWSLSNGRIILRAMSRFQKHGLNLYSYHCRAYRLSCLRVRFYEAHVHQTVQATPAERQVDGRLTESACGRHACLHQLQRRGGSVECHTSAQWVGRYWLLRSNICELVTLCTFG